MRVIAELLIMGGLVVLAININSTVEAVAVLAAVTGSILNGA